MPTGVPHPHQHVPVGFSPSIAKVYHWHQNSMKQIDKMRQLYQQLNGDEPRIIAAYAAAERNGEVRRKSNK